MNTKKSVIFLSGLLFIFLNLSGCTLPSQKGISGDNTTVDSAKRVTGVRNFLKEFPVKNSNRVALVIGNGDYETQALFNPIYDAQDMSNTLNKLGFSVIQVLNADKAMMEKAIQKFGRELYGDIVSLVYYSGHGVQYNGKNYMIPIGAVSAINNRKPRVLNTDAIGLDSVLSIMENAKNRLNLVVLDACRDNPFSGFKKGEQKPGLAPIGSAEGMLIAYATSPNKAALTSTKRNSPYTKHLLHFMKNSVLPIELMLKQVRVAVKKETDGKQTPWYSASIEGNFTFVDKH